MPVVSSCTKIVIEVSPARAMPGVCPYKLVATFTRRRLELSLRSKDMPKMIDTSTIK